MLRIQREFGANVNPVSEKWHHVHAECIVDVSEILIVSVFSFKLEIVRMAETSEIWHTLCHHPEIVFELAIYMSVTW
jgi:hypothetical protein